MVLQTVLKQFYVTWSKKSIILTHIYVAWSAKTGPFLPPIERIAH